MENQESLESSALICELSDAVQDQIDQLLSDGVMTTGVVVSGILFASDQLLGVEQLAVSSGADLIYNSWLQIDEHSTWDVLAGSSLAEEGVEGVVSSTDRLVRWHLAIRLDTVLETVQFPASITDLDSGLANVD
jgi:hypothetical protein